MMRCFVLMAVLAQAGLAAPNRATPPGADAVVSVTAESAEDAQDRQANERNPDPPASAPAQPDAEALQRERQNREREIAIQEDIASVTRTLVLVGGGVGALQVALMFWTGLVSHRAAKAALAAVDLNRQSFVVTERPKVIVRNIYIDPLDQFRWVQALAIGGYSGYFHVVNIGGTRATVTHVLHGVYFTHHLQMRRPYNDATEGVPVRIVLEPGMRMQLVIDHTHLTKEEAETVDSGTSIYFIALINYEDDLGHGRQTGVCRRLEPDPHRGSRFVAVADPDYEYAD